MELQFHPPPPQEFQFHPPKECQFQFQPPPQEFRSEFQFHSEFRSINPPPHEFQMEFQFQPQPQLQFQSLQPKE